MNKIVTRISDLMRLQPHDIAPGVSVFPIIDSRSIATRLKLDQRAQADGESNAPPAEARDLGATEQEIVAALSTIRQQGLSDYADELKLYEQRMHAVDLDGRISEISRSIMNGITTLRQKGFTGRTHLYQNQEDVREHEEAVRAFRKQNRLTRPPATPRNKALSWGILGVLFLVEIVLNGAFLATNNLLGLMGGLGAAAGIAFVNLSVALLLGRGAIYANHVQFLKKAGGVLAFLCAVGFALAFNLLVAHFRDLAGVMPWDEAALAAVARFVADPFGLQSFEAVMLFCVGCLFAALAFLDGLTWTDFYPGYPALVRQRDRARELYAQEVEDLVEELKDAKDDTLDIIDEARRELTASARNYLQAYNGRLGLQMGLPIFLDDVDQKVNALLSRYREINQGARSEAAPRHFAERHRFARQAPGGDPANGAQIEALNRLMDQADQVLETRTEELLETFETVMREYRSLKQVARAEAGDGPA